MPDEEGLDPELFAITVASWMRAGKPREEAERLTRAGMLRAKEQQGRASWVWKKQVAEEMAARERAREAQRAREQGATTNEVVQDQLALPVEGEREPGADDDPGETRGDRPGDDDEEIPF